MKDSSDCHKRTISSDLTFFYKYIFSTVWVGIGAYGTFSLFNSHQNESKAFLIAWIVGTFFIYWFCIRLKRIQINRDNIYISNYFKTVKVPLLEIKLISENLFVNTHPIWITFHISTGFGRKIMFIPKHSFRTLFFRSHPIVNELLTLVRHKKEITESIEL